MPRLRQIHCSGQGLAYLVQELLLPFARTTVSPPVPSSPRCHPVGQTWLPSDEQTSACVKPTASGSLKIAPPNWASPLKVAPANPAPPLKVASPNPA